MKPQKVGFNQFLVTLAKKKLFSPVNLHNKERLFPIYTHFCISPSFLRLTLTLGLTSMNSASK